MSPWTIAVIIGVATLALRASFIVAGGTEPSAATSSGRFDQLRRFVPIAALSALIVPALVPHAGEPLSARPLAAIAAVLVALRVRNMLAPVVLGLTLFWLVS